MCPYIARQTGQLLAGSYENVFRLVEERTVIGGLVTRSPFIGLPYSTN